MSIFTIYKQNEYYLTDIIELLITHEKMKIETYELKNNETHQALGVNTEEELHSLLEQFKIIL